MGRTGITLTRFIIETQAGHPAASGEFSALLAQIGLAGKLITHDLRRAGLINILGTTGGTNVQGEAVKKLDAIFSILRYEGKGGLPSAPELVRKGTEQVAAGYLMYGSSTMLVFTSGQGVHGFTLDPGIGEYLLSHENIRMPARGKVYAVNEGNYHKWPAGTRRYIDHLKESDKATGRPYSSRYSGCLAADVHRLLLGGGIYLYPGETDQAEGKLRLLYEANPLALVVEQAGGRASTGTMRILDVEPKALHQRVPLLIGSAEDVSLAEAFIQGKR